MSDGLVNRLQWAATLGDLTTTSARNLMEEAAARIAELEAAIYQYVNHVVSYEGISFIDEMNEPSWAKLINNTWVKQAGLEGRKKE